VNDSQPGLRGASISIGMIADDGPNARPGEKPAIFRRALHVLYETNASLPEQTANRYLLGRLYAVWMVVNLPGTKTITTRGDLGLAGAAAGTTHDLYMAMDSAFAKVEAENPACADSTVRYRRAVAQMAFNAARLQLAAKNYDSAVVLAKRALIADPRAPGPSHIFEEVNKKRSDTTTFREPLHKLRSRQPVLRGCVGGPLHCGVWFAVRSSAIHIMQAEE
jgi:hypothetical protein